jgi:CubicO group peptidase (beta-lactamase class C family)
MTAMLNETFSRRTLLRGSALLGAGAALNALPFAGGQAFAADDMAAWPQVTALIDRYVSARKVSGMIAALGWGAAPPGTIARGVEGFTDADPIGADSLFRAYSMTKPLTGMAAMMLIDEGRLGLDQKIADFIPEFAEMRVAVDPATGLDSVPATTAITIRHLLTHTSGFGYAGVGQDKVSAELLRLGVVPAVVSRMTIPGISAPVPTPDTAEFIRRAATVPLVAEPGTRWKYSMGLDILGIIIERAAKAASFGAFLQERLLDPIGMSSTFFQLPKSNEHRLTTNYGIVGGNALPIDKAENSIFEDRPAFAFGGAGLVTSPSDYDRFLMMLVGGGMIGGKRVMSEKAVAMGTSNLLPAVTDTAGTMVQGAGFGAGGRVGLGDDAGSFGWSGAAGTVGFINARVGLRAGLFVQYMPSFALPVQREFIDATRTDVLAKFRA